MIFLEKCTVEAEEHGVITLQWGNLTNTVSDRRLKSTSAVISPVGGMYT
jgi:hypothetical protein